MMDSREEILGRLRTQAGEVVPPPVWKSRHAYADLTAQFNAGLSGVGGEVTRAASFEDALDNLGTLLADLNVQHAAVNHEPPLDSVPFSSRWPEIDWHFAGESAGDLKAFCANADVGISGADAALAETGSIVVASGPGRSRMVTLLPPVHVALVSTACLTSDISTWAAGRSGAMPASLNIISGPSKTADIEQVLAVGVHGPKRFIVILYD
jgi:L-lactate dehydrogenase complex protein LldG